MDVGTYTIPGSETASGLPKPKCFCTRCGCTLYTVPAKWNGERIVVRTTLFQNADGATLLKPEEEWFTDSRLGWCGEIESAGQYQKGRAVP
jgi:hypothetical protein